MKRVAFSTRIHEESLRRLKLAAQIDGVSVHDMLREAIDNVQPWVRPRKKENRMKENDQTVWLDVGPIQRETEKAELRQVEDGESEWIPKSQIKARSPRGRIEVTRWWAVQRGYVDERDER